MNPYLLYAVDLVAVTVLTFALHFPRHRRRDLAVAYLGVNAAVLTVASVLASTSIAAGLGLGLFGVLSITRLHSTELSQHEVEYYFAAWPSDCSAVWVRRPAGSASPAPL